MVTVLQQDIPSDKNIYYRRSLIEATDKAGYQYATQQYGKRLYGPAPSQLYNNRYGDNLYHGRPYGANLFQHLPRVTSTRQMQFVRKRMQHIWPRMQNDSPFSPSAAQKKVREAFKRCCNCFGMQPWSGGAEPDGDGGYSRTWWYSKAEPWGLWYYNYFISETWYDMFIDDPPKWCIEKSLGDTYVEEWAPNNNYASRPYFYACKDPDDDYWTYIKTDIEKPRNLWLWPIYGQDIHRTIGVYEVNEKYDTNTITWNTRPEVGNLISTFDTYCVPTAWKKVQVLYKNSICLKGITSTQFPASWRSSEYGDIERRPYFTM